MSYTHTLSIQGVHATLQMNVEHSIVSYTLTLRAESGETVVANGRLPNDVMDNFMVINQYVKNPALTEVKHTSEQGVQTCLKQSVTEHIITDIFDFINQGQKQHDLIQENQLHHSQTDMTVPNQSLHSDSLSENFSPILPSSPKHVDDSCFAKDCFAQELQDLSGRTVEKQLTPITPVKEEPPIYHVAFSPTAIIEQLQYIRQYSNPTIKNGIVQAAQQYLSENNITILEYPTLCVFIKELFYEMIVLHINDNVLVDKFIEMLYLAGETSHEVNLYRDTIYRQYVLLCRVATYYKITLNDTSFVDYRKWKETYHGPALDRWHLMKTYLESTQ